MLNLQGAQVLVVEDEYFIAQDLQKTLEAAGAHVIGPVANVAAALELIQTKNVDAAVLDLNLHGVVDFAIAEELSRRNIPFVFATGYEPATVPRTYDHIPLWQKPFVVDDLIKDLARWDFGRDNSSVR